jgi:hypothetical protein
MCKKIKTSFTNVSAYSSEDNFILGDLEGVIEWISGEVEAFEEILSDRRDVCAFSGARRVAAISEKAGCEHVKLWPRSKLPSPSMIRRTHRSKQAQ